MFDRGPSKFAFKTKISLILQSILAIILIGAVSGGPTSLWAATVDELKREIEKKNQELQALNVQIQETQSQVSQLQSQGKTLKQALAALGYQINQLNLSIRSSEINIEKLKLELQALGYKISDVSQDIDSNEEAIAEILRQLQQRDNEGLLEILLKNNSLADGLFEYQTLRDLQDTLSVKVKSLNDLKSDLQQAVDETTVKKMALEQENLNLKNRKLIVAEQQSEKDRLLKETKNQEALYQKRLEQLEKQQQLISDEISRLESELKANFNPNSVPGRKAGLLAWPLPDGQRRITQYYGETENSYRWYKGKPHNGIDVGAPIGTPVYAAADGRVVRVDYNGLYYQYGRYVLIDHGNNLSTLYAHLSQSVVGSGQTVVKGQLVGYVGDTGFVTGPHLHFGVYATPAGGWQLVSSKLEAGLISLPPASGLVPLGVTLNPLDYL